MPAVVGAELGAVLCGFRWPAVDSGGLEGARLHAVGAALDAHGLRIRRVGLESTGMPAEKPAVEGISARQE